MSTNEPLGWVVFFSVPDKPVSLKALRKYWLAAELDQSSLPADPRSLYLFKRAMRDQEGKVKQPDGTVTETTVVDLLETSDHCVYQVSLVVRDVDNRQVEYPKALRVSYNKQAHEMKFDLLGDVRPVHVKPIVGAIEAYMEQNAQMVDGRKVRTLIRNYLNSELFGENLRGKAGGVSFVSGAYKHDLNHLAEALRHLYAYEGPTYGLTAIPLADDDAGRELVGRHFVANNLKEIGDATADVIKLLRGERKNVVRSDVIAHHKARAQMLQRHADNYAALLRENDQAVAAALATLNDTLDKLA